MTGKGAKQRFGVIGGLGALGGADIFFKLVKLTPSPDGREQSDIIFEQHPFAERDRSTRKACPTSTVRSSTMRAKG